MQLSEADSEDVAHITALCASPSLTEEICAKSSCSMSRMKSALEQDSKQPSWRCCLFKENIQAACGHVHEKHEAMCMKQLQQDLVPVGH